MQDSNTKDRWIRVKVRVSLTGSGPFFIEIKAGSVQAYSMEDRSISLDNGSCYEVLNAEEMEKFVEALRNTPKPLWIEPSLISMIGGSPQITIEEIVARLGPSKNMLMNVVTALGRLIDSGIVTCDGKCMKNGQHTLRLTES